MKPAQLDLSSSQGEMQVIKPEICASVLPLGSSEGL